MRLRAQDGFTLIETLVAGLLLAVVLGATLALLEQGERTAAADRERAVVLHEAQAGLARLVREARQAHRIHQATPTRLDFEARIQGRDRRTVVECTTACTRTEVPGDGTSQVLVDRVLNGDVFAYTPSASAPTYVTVKVEVPAAGERADGFDHSSVLTDGFVLRNAGAS